MGRWGWGFCNFIALLVMFANDRRLMGEFVNPRWLQVLAGAVATLIVGLNLWLLLQTALGWLKGA